MAYAYKKCLKQGIANEMIVHKKLDVTSAKAGMTSES